MIYLVTHNLDGTPIVKLPKTTKVGIGMPKGKAIHTYISNANQWVVEIGYDSKSSKAVVHKFDSRKAAQAFYREQWSGVPVCPFPRKLSYFTFLQPSPSGEYVHDFDVIEANGPKPTSVDVFFMVADPMDSGMRYWSASELKCHGDGLNAWRVLAMAESPEEKAAAADAKARGEREFKVLDACSVGGCRFSAPTVSNGKEGPPPCKMSGELEFQLASNIRIGTKSFYHTTGRRTIEAMNSALIDMATITGGSLRGIPAQLVVKGFTSNHNGQAARQYYVHPEFRATDMKQVRDRFLQGALEFATFSRRIQEAAPKVNEKLAIAAAQDSAEQEEDDPGFAARMTSEFYPNAGDEDEDEPAAAETVMEAKTQEKVEALKEDIKGEAPLKETLADRAQNLRQRVEETVNVESEKPTTPKATKKPSPFD
jgi:hypothetical protein